MPIPNEDRLRDQYDEMNTHNDPHSPYYDGPDDDEICEHGVPFDEECEECNAEDDEEEESNE